MKLRSIVATAACGFALLFVPQTARAGLITSVTSTDTDVAIAVIDPGSSTYTPGTTSPINNVGSGSVIVDLEVFKLHSPIQLVFSYAARPSSDPGQFGATYDVVLRVKNSVSSTQNRLDFNGFDLTNSVTVTGGVSTSGLQPDVAITSSPSSTRFGVLYSGDYNIPSGFRWGGLNGGGPRLAPGQTAVNTFSISNVWSGRNASTARLNFVANPEPATILLGSLAMVPAGIAAHRRRKNAKAALVAAA
jgi:hypothetical protein